MRVDVSPRHLEARPNTVLSLQVQIFNTAEIISAYRVRILGLDQSWVEIDEPQLSLFPDTSGFVTVTMRLPEGLPAGIRRIGVQIGSLTDEATTEVVEVDLAVIADQTATVILEPNSIYGARKAIFGLVVVNEGNTVLPVSFEGEDEEDKLHFAFDPPTVDIDPGERATVSARIHGRRPIMGSAAARTFKIVTKGPDPAPLTIGSFIQKPLISRGLLSLMGLLVAVSVFAAVITATLSTLVDESRQNDDLLLDVLNGEDAAGVPDNPGSIAGSVTLLTAGTGVPGVTVELFAADDTAVSKASTATTEQGGYEFGGLNEGSFKLRFRGAGFTEIWYPAALTPDEAAEVKVELGKETGDVDVRLGGVPGSISGKVLGEDPAGATVTLRVPADAAASALAAQSGEEEVGAAIASTAVDATGEFLLENVPAPSSYQLTVEKEGFASETRDVNMATAEIKENVEIRLRRGDGSITGQIFTGNDPLGGAVITATDGETTLTTVSLTTDSVGVFTLRNLPTPGTYTLVIAKDGFRAETLTVNLTKGEEAVGIGVTLAGGSGTVTGTVRLVDSQTGDTVPASGVIVTITDGELVLKTVTLSGLGAGTYEIGSVPVPGTYTLNFERSDLRSQTRSIDLDPTGGAVVTADATLVQSTGTIFGKTTEKLGGAAAPGVTVTFSKGDQTFKTLTANTPIAGGYEVRSLPPGTYTVTFSRAGSQSVTFLVNLGSGERLLLNAELEPRAKISGTVYSSLDESTPRFGATINLYKVSQFPGLVLKSTTTAANGTYSFSDLDAPETYIVEFAGQDTTTVSLDAGEQRGDVSAFGIL